jgi:hypothetical protein
MATNTQEYNYFYQLNLQRQIASREQQHFLCSPIICPKILQEAKGLKIGGFVGPG